MFFGPTIESLLKKNKFRKRETMRKLLITFYKDD